MTPLHAVVLGLVQGATEFLPVSSSAHLLLVPVVLGWPDQGLAFDAAVHLGTALALLCYFAPELARLARGVLAGRADDRRLGLAVIVGTAPAAAVGALFERAIETRLRSAAVVAWASIAWAAVLWWADRRSARNPIHEVERVGVGRGLLIGASQVLALVPGTSRSGVTLSAGLFTGLDRATAARFAFLLGLPITAGAGLLKAASILRHGAAGPGGSALAIGVLTSFAAGLAAVWLLLAYLRRRTLLLFVVYRVVLGALILLFL